MGGTAADVLAWTGSDLDGDWDNANNWVTAAGSPTTTTPSASESVVMDDRAVYPILLAPSSAVALSGFKITSACNVGIGTSGTSLTDVTVTVGSGATLECAGNGHYYFNGNCDVLRVNNTGSGGFHYTGGTAAESECAGGTLNNYGTMSDLHVTGGVFVGQSGSTLTAINLKRGVARTEVSAGTATVGGGYLQLLKSAGATTLNIHGGRVNLQTDGTITTMNGHGGRLDALGNRRTAPVITTATYWRKTFSLIKEYEGGAITVTNDGGKGYDGTASTGGGPIGLGDL